jgi:two-component system cell cycle sensor histidine kinase PleC
MDAATTAPARAPESAAAYEEPAGAGADANGHWTECAKLMARISHELRTPLNAIIGFADMMRRELLGPIGHPRYREYVDHIRDSGAGLLKSAEDIMTLTSVAAGSTQERIVPVAVEPLVREACRSVAVIADAKRVRIHMSGIGQRALWGDRSALQLVTGNLLAATVERAAYGASIVVRMAGTLSQPRLEVSTSASLGEPVAATSHRDEIPDLTIAVASCLVRLQGGRLLTTTTPDGGWSVRMILPGGGVVTTQQAWARAA